jgi:hypothetical protein
MLDQTTEQSEKTNIYHVLGMVKNWQGKYTEAVEFYEKALKIGEKILSSSDPNAAPSYN